MSHEDGGSRVRVRGSPESPPSHPPRRLSSNIVVIFLVTFAGKVFVILQLSLALTGVVTSTVYNEIYQLTMEKFVGTCFALSSFLSFLAIIPIG